MVGTSLNHYRIIKSLGSGGMGEVYAAEDTKLHRTVALKVLPAAMAADPERRERFDREAQSVAALNHPNIVTVHSVEQSGDVSFLTMELVEGKTLGELLGKHGLPLDQFFRFAIPIADAVSAAHERGITHRDLKPANIMVGSDGRVKILDFGLAKLREDQATAGVMTSLPTKQLTGDGRVLGTVAYMSPEQAEGKLIDHRSDIFSLGIVLYEMATGERPFKGDTNVSVLSSILKDTPTSVTDLNRTLPRELGRIIRHALVKDPTHRYQTATDLRNELEELKQEVDSGEAFPVKATTPGQPQAAGRRRWIAAAITVLAVALFVGGGYSWLRSFPSSDRTRAAIDASFTQLTSQSGVEHFPSLSSDGRWMLYESEASGNGDIYLQSVGGQNAINLTKDSAEDDSQPAFSPDGERIAFRSERQGGGIFLMGRTGESVRRLTDTGFNPAWSPDGTTIVFASESVVTDPASRSTISQLWTVNVSTGERRRLSEGDAVQPNWSPHGSRIACWGLPKNSAQRDLFTLPASGGPLIPVMSDTALDWNPVWSPDGTFLYFVSDRGGSMNLWRVAMDEAAGRALGQPESITTPSTFVGHLSLAADGRRIAYSSSTVTSNIRKVEFDPVSETVKGQTVAITTGSRLFIEPDLSPDGQSLVFRNVGQEDLFLSRSDGAGLRQLTDDPARDRVPVWTPDGKRISFYSNRGGHYQVWEINPDGGGLKPITDVPDGALFSTWSPDGLRLATVDGDIGDKIYILDPAKSWKEQKARVVRLGPGVTLAPSSWSPDGRRLALINNIPDGHFFVYSLTSGSFQDLGQGGAPIWLGDSRRVMFQRGEALFVEDVDSKKVREVYSAKPDRLYSYNLSRDNHQLFVARGSNEADIWMVTIK